MVATNALTGYKFPSDAASVLMACVCYAGLRCEVLTNNWLSKKEVEGLALALKPNANPVSVTFKVTDGAPRRQGVQKRSAR